MLWHMSSKTLTTLSLSLNLASVPAVELAAESATPSAEAVDEEDDEAALLSIARLNQLRDMVLNGQFEREFSTALHSLFSNSVGSVQLPDVTVAVDRSRFAAMYEMTILRLDTLTPHQQQVLTECEKNDHQHVHIDAAAGTGKTFIALHRLLHILLNDPEAMVLFVAKSPALAFFFVGWLVMRVEDVTAKHASHTADDETIERQRGGVLRRVHVLYSSNFGTPGSDLSLIHI